jgi:thiamine biosynthesis lipoprotein
VSRVYVHGVSLMGTVVTFQVVGHDVTATQRAERVAAVERAVGWFRHVEEHCSRFDAKSEVSQLTRCAGAPIHVSETLFQTVQFALALAHDTDGAFDPTIGHRMEARGFDREYRSGDVVHTDIDAPGDASYRDVHVDADRRTITLERPLMLDLGGVAKGLAVDIAARELAPFENFAIDAGGDLFLGGHNADGEAWSVGIRHPRDHAALFDTFHVSDVAVCTSGDYERSSPNHPTEHHIMDPRTGHSARGAASVTVVAPVAMVADGLGTAAFVMGPERGLALLERHGVEGMIVTPSLERFETRGVPRG